MMASAGRTVTNIFLVDTTRREHRAAYDQCRSVQHIE